MSANPGWYADPTMHGGLRWWDGAAWTHHVSAGPAQAGTVSTGAGNPYVATAYSYNNQVGAARTSSKAWIGWVVGGVVAAMALFALAVPVVRHQAEKRRVTCGVVAPPDAPAATKAYVAALYRVHKAQAAYTVYVNQQGGASASVTPEMLRMYRALEQEYADALARIHFTGRAATDAATMVAGNRAVIADIDALLAAPTQANRNILRDDLEALDGRPLRDDLGLPYNSGCSFWQPA